MAASTMSIRVEIHLIGKLAHLEPWRAAFPAIGERVVVEPNDYTGSAARVRFSFGGSRIMALRWGKD